MPALHDARNTAGTSKCAFLCVPIRYHTPKAIHLFSRYLLIAYCVLGCREARKQATDKVSASLFWPRQLFPGLETAKVSAAFPAPLQTIYTKGQGLPTSQVPRLGGMGENENTQITCPQEA